MGEIITDIGYIYMEINSLQERLAGVCREFDAMKKERDTLQAKLTLMETERNGYASELQIVAEQYRNLSSQNSYIFTLEEKIRQLQDKLHTGIYEIKKALVSDGDSREIILEQLLKKLEEK